MPVIILRGISGSGKSHLAKLIKAKVESEIVPIDLPSIKGLRRKCIIISADQYFESGGKYLFNPSELSRAHSDCFMRYMNALQRFDVTQFEDDTLIVDNTNIHAWEISPYVLAANAHDVPYQIMNVYCEFDIAMKRQTHGVAADTMRRMFSEFMAERLPPFWITEASDDIRRLL